jgi:hypothetical protein
MQLSTTYHEAELRSPDRFEASSILVRSLASVLVTDIIHDPGDGWMPLKPLEVQVDGQDVVLPQTLSAGIHRITLSGQTIDAMALMLIGYELHNIVAMQIAGPFDDVSIPSSGSGRLWTNQPLVGAVDGVNRDFYTLHNFRPGSTMLRVGGSFQRSPQHYIEYAPNRVHLLFDTIGGEPIDISYQQE